MSALREVLHWLTPADRRATLWLVGWSLLLAGCAGAYGLLVGPALRALFGGPPLAWPAAMAGWAPPPPSVAALRRGLPWIIVGVAALKAGARFGYSRAAARLGVALTVRLQRAVHRRALVLPADTMAALGSGSVASLLVNDAPAAQQLWVDGHLRQVRDGLQLVVLTGVCLVLDWRMAAVGLLVYPVAFWPMDRLRRGLRSAARAGLEDVGALTGELTESFARLAAVQRTGRPDVAADAVDQILDRWRAARVRAAVLGALASPLTELLGAVALAAVLVWSTQRVVSGEVAPEHALGFFVALLLVYEPAKGLARAQAVIAPGRAGLARIQAFLDRPERLPSGEGGLAPPAGGVSLRLEDVVVRRGGRTVLAVERLHLEPGELVAIVGPNGAGKSTLAWLLSGLLCDWSGTVDVGGLPLGELAPDPWRRRIGWVDGAHGLGRGTLRAAVSGGAATDEGLAPIAAAVGLSAVLARLPQGWDTELGEAGAGLSSGEAQRVRLAAALWGDPAILVLDEPEAHLDAAGRDALARQLPSLTAASRLLLVITHDPSLIAQADRVVCVDDGWIR